MIDVRESVQRYYQLTKPGIVLSNTMIAAAAFLYGSGRAISWPVFAGLAIGVYSIVGSSCVLNNYLDRSIDRSMQRTKNRSLASGTIPVRHAFVFAASLFVIGSASLLLLTNWLTWLLGVTGVIFYVVVYGYAKRKSPYGTLVGTISGAIPPVAGYTAATGRLDLAALVLFATLAVWQLPHFYAISIFRREDYATAGIPVWSVARGIDSTILQIRLCALLFMLIAPLLILFDRTSVLFGLVMLMLALWWLSGAMEGGLKPEAPTAWARKVFGQSLIVLLGLSLFLSVNAWLPF